MRKTLWGSWLIFKVDSLCEGSCCGVETGHVTIHNLSERIMEFQRQEVRVQGIEVDGKLVNDDLGLCQIFLTQFCHSRDENDMELCPVSDTRGERKEIGGDAFSGQGVWWNDEDEYLGISIWLREVIWRNCEVNFADLKLPFVLIIRDGIITYLISLHKSRTDEKIQRGNN